MRTWSLGGVMWPSPLNSLEHLTARNACGCAINPVSVQYVAPGRIDDKRRLAKGQRRRLLQNGLNGP